MITIRVDEKVIVPVIKLIKRYFIRLFKFYYDNEQYELYKNNFDEMYKKIEQAVDEKYDWYNTDFGIRTKATRLLGNLEYILEVYKAFIKYKQTPHALTKYKIEVSLSPYLCEKLDKFLEEEVAYRLFFTKNPSKELGDILDFQEDLQMSILAYKDKSIAVSFKADECTSWDNIWEEDEEDGEINTNIVHEVNIKENTQNETRFADESFLYKLGYKITGLTRYQRWDILKNKAIPQLGLDGTVRIITSLIETRKLQQNGETKYAHAIKEWTYDLSRLADLY